MAILVLDNANLWIGDGSTYKGHVVIDNGTIDRVGRGRYGGDLPTTDLVGAALSPGMIDLMVLGGFDLSIMRDDQVQLARHMLKLGVTSMQTCIGTLPWDGVRRVADGTRRAQAVGGVDAARIIGLYPEGPYQHPDMTGGSLRDHALPASAYNVRKTIDELGDVVTLINVSPGIDGDADAVRTFCQAGMVVTMAHSKAPADRVQRCVGAGTCVLGHVWDNNSGLIGDSGVQQPTIEHVALTDERVRTIHLICDGTHVHPVLVRLVLRCRGVEAVCLVTDCNQKAGCADGTFTWDDGRTFYKEGGVCRTDQGWLAGSATLLPDDFRNFVKFTGIEPHVAIRTVSFNPAESLGMTDQFGVIAPGRAADLITWDDKLRVTRVWRAGHEIGDVSPFAEVRL